MDDKFPGGFAVLMAVYGRDDPALFKMALGSVFDNTLQPTEVWVVVDGAISPELDTVLLGYQQAHVACLRIVRLEENQGLAHALNAGLELIKLPWIVRADADDRNLPHRFASLAKLLGNRPELDLMSSAILEVTPAGEKIAVREVPGSEREIYRFAKSRNPFNHMAAAYRREKVLEVGGYPAIHLKEDYALWCLMLAKKARVGNLPEILVYATAGLDMYRRRGGWKYAKAEWVMQRLLVSCGLKSWWQAGADGFLRAAVFLTPAAVRGAIYARMLRRRYKDAGAQTHVGGESSALRDTPGGALSRNGEAMWKVFASRVKKLLSRFGIGKGKGYSVSQAMDKSLPLDKLHLGCGNIHIDGWCNVDVIKTGAADLVADITTLPGVPNDSVQIIYSCHALEHFSTSSIPGVLARWHEVLRPGGELRISVPDLDKITKIYQDNIAHFQVEGNQPWIALIYGGQKDQFDFHKTGFNLNWMRHLLKRTGFREVERYENSPHFIEGVIDNSLADAPFGEYISLNVKAIK